MRFWWIISLMFAVPAHAEVARVQSGEHADFSRLVIELPEERAWTLGRTTDGYELALEGERLGFDVSGVFDLIPKDRLTGIFADPVSGNLRLTIGCACYALPFSLNERTIVIDLRKGAAPEGSSFETGLNGAALPPLLGETQPEIRPRPRQISPAAMPKYDWLMAALPDLPPPTPFAVEPAADVAESLRETLVEQLAEGAARNMVDLAIPDVPTTLPGGPALSADLPIRINGEVGLRLGVDRTQEAALQPNGAACFSDDDLDLPSWGETDPALPPYTGLSNGMVGEFDRPHQEAVIAAAKRLVFLGFGVETRALLQAFEVEGPESDMLKAMSYIVDGDQPPDRHAFFGMADCDTTAVLWAYLAEGPKPASGLSTVGLLRAFSALPVHLRVSLGPQIVSHLLEQDNMDVAEQIRELMDRGTISDVRSVALVTSDLLLAQGENEMAVQQAEEVLADPGTFEADALIALVQAQVAAGQIVAPEVVESLAVLIEEHEGDLQHDALVDAYGLALAGSGQFATARAFAQNGRQLDPVFWKVLASEGTDDDLLLQALQPDNRTAEPEVAKQIAERLVALGFPNEADSWRAIAMMPDGTEARPMAGMVDPEPMAETPDTTGARWSQNWPSVAEQDQGVWGELSSGLEPAAAVVEDVSLSSATETLAQSEKARGLIESLLAETGVNAAQP